MCKFTLAHIWILHTWLQSLPHSLYSTALHGLWTSIKSLLSTVLSELIKLLFIVFAGLVLWSTFSPVFHSCLCLKPQFKFLHVSGAYRKKGSGLPLHHDYNSARHPEKLYLSFLVNWATSLRPWDRAISALPLLLPWWDSVYRRDKEGLFIHASTKSLKITQNHLQISLSDSLCSFCSLIAPVSTNTH